MLSLLPLVVVVALFGSMLLVDRPDQSQGLDDDLCALDPTQTPGRAALLLDFRKPLDQANLSLPGELLHDVSLALAANTELRVFALATEPHAARFPLDRACKPYDDADLQIATAKDQRNTPRDCDDLPAQLPSALRDAAKRYCDRREALRNRIDALARNRPATPVTNSYLIEALEDTVIDLSEGSGSRTIYVFSDMMQHAEWYSHLDLHWTDWNFTDFAERRARQTSRLGRRPSASNLAVQVYYLPRLDLTESPPRKRAHQAFWREYFGDDTQLVFHEQPTSPGYAALPLMEALDPEAEVPAASRADTEADSRAAPTVIAEAESEAAPGPITEAESEPAPTLPGEEETPAAAEVAASTEADQPPETAPSADATANVSDSRAAPTVIAEADSEASPGPITEAESQPVSTLPGEEETAAAAEVAASTEADQPPETAPGADATANVSDARGPESVGDVAQRGVDVEPTPDEPSLPACAVRLAPGVDEEAPYPFDGLFDFGNALIVVRYVVDEAGATPDDLVEVVRERSRLDRQSIFSRFARTARQTVQGWRFTFDDPDDTSCTREQTRLIGFQFVYREI